MSQYLLSILIAALTFQPALACLEHQFENLPAGGRKAAHGMVLFGGAKYFIEHIPMLTPPHDFQVITEVRLKDKNGTEIHSDFSKQGFTIEPTSSFSLNDFIAGRLKVFNGNIHQGGFEQGGPAVPGLQDISVEVVSYQVIRQLPAHSPEKVFHLSDGLTTFESAVITPDSNQQMIRNTTTGTTLWCVTGPDFFDPCH